MSHRTTFRPDAIAVEERTLRRFRSQAELLAVNRRRLYGLALEFAVANADEFRTYARDGGEKPR